MIRVLLAEDQVMVRGALAALLRLEPDIEIVAEVGRGDEVLREARATRPDVALLDIELPGGDGLQAAADLHGQMPECRILMLTTFGRPGYLRRAMANGAVGFLTKDAPAEQLSAAIRRAMKGEKVIDPQLAMDALSDGDSPLTGRERDVLEAVGRGEGIAATARRLFLSEGTVRNYLSMAIQKVGAANRIEAWKTARDKGWLA